MALDYPISNEDKKAIENTKFDVFDILKLIAGLPVLTEVPTYIGRQGEIVLLSGSPNKIYIYINGTWTGISGGYSYTQVNQSEHNPSTTDWEDYDISAIVPVGTKFVDVVIHNSGADARTGKTRSNGDTTITTVLALSAGLQFQETCPVDTNRIIEIKGSDTTDVGFRVLGYWS